jgi:hypothetical protein
MRLTTYLILLTAVPLLVVAADQKKPSARPAPPAAPTTIPKEAKQIEPHTWRHTDRQGHTWIYRKTPFGVVRYAESAPEAQPTDEIPPNMTAVEEGDSIRFERPTPFGKHRWTRKKVWERERQKDAPPKSNPQE